MQKVKQIWYCVFRKSNEIEADKYLLKHCLHILTGPEEKNILYMDLNKNKIIKLKQNK